MFETTLRESVTTARRGLEQARLEEQPAQIHQYAARLLDLLDRAGAGDIDTTDWVPATVMAVVRAAADDG